MGGIASTAAKLLASLDLDTKPFEAGARRAGGALGKMESRFGRIGKIAQQGLGNAANNIKKIGVAAAGLIATQVYAGIRSLEELERVTNATAGVIQSTGGAAGISAEQVRQYAEQLEQVTTADDKVIQSGENLLLTFTGIGKQVFPQATKAMVDLGIAMAQGDVANADFKSSAIQIGKALNDPVRGFTALRRVGVSFTAEQEKRIKGFVKEGKVVEAQKIILAELEKEFGKAGEAAGKGFGADMRRAQDAIEGAQQALARGFLPVISRVSAWLQTTLADPAVIAGIEDFGKGLAAGFDQAVEFAKQIPWGTIVDAAKALGNGAKTMLEMFSGMPDLVKTAVLTGWGLNKLTGGAITGVVGSIMGAFTKGAVNAFASAGIGKAFVQPVFVTNPGFGAGGGGVPGVAPAGGGFLSSLAAGALPLTIAAFAPVALVELTKAILGGEERIQERDLDARRETAEARGQDPTRITGPRTGPRDPFAEWVRSGATVALADHSLDRLEMMRDLAFRESKRTLRKYGEVEDKRGAVNWEKIAKSTEATKVKTDQVKQRSEAIRTSVERMRGSIASELARVRSAITANQRLQATIPITVNIGDYRRTSTYTTSTWLNDSTSGGNIRGGAD